MRYLLYVTFVLGIADLAVHGEDNYCYGKDEERLQVRHFSSLMAYEIIKGTNMEKQYLVPNCEPKKIWILHRHGTRLPTERVILQAPRLDDLRDLVVKNYETRNTKRTVSELCAVDYYNFKIWRWNSSITVDQAEYLTSQGYADLRGTAKLYQKFYPNILTKDYDSKQFLFRHTQKQRTTESFKAFTEGLFGPDNNAQSEPVPEEDYLLRPYDSCESWKEYDYKGPNTEVYKFKHSDIWNDTIKEVSTRLGFDYVLESEDVELMFDICRYEQAWKVDRTSSWCAAFKPEHIYVLEYGEDLHYYYKCGYGYEENSRLSCRLVQDMLTHLNSPTGPNAVAYFAHSVAIQTTLTALGIAKDDVSLLATNYHNMTERRWTTSSLDPFASNLLAVKYECNEQAEERENVIFFLNQNALFLDWCKVGLCSWNKTLERYNNFFKADCSSYYCRSGAPLIGASFIPNIIAAIAYLIY